MPRRLAVLIVLALGMSMAPAEASDDYGGGVATWSSTPKALKHRTPDGCTPEQFHARLEMPALVVESEDFSHRGPLILTGVGGGWPCTWGDSGGWVELVDNARGCSFKAFWFDFTWSVTETLMVSMWGNCGPKQLELVAEMVVTAPGRAAGAVVVSNCY